MTQYGIEVKLGIEEAVVYILRFIEAISLNEQNKLCLFKCSVLNFDNERVHFDFSCVVNFEHLENIVKFVAKTVRINAFLVNEAIKFVNFVYFLAQFVRQAARIAHQVDLFILGVRTVSKLNEQFFESLYQILLQLTFIILVVKCDLGQDAVKLLVKSLLLIEELEGNDREEFGRFVRIFLVNLVLGFVF